MSVLKAVWQVLKDGGEDLGSMPTGCHSTRKGVLIGEDPDTLQADDDVVPAAGSDEDDDQLEDSDWQQSKSDESDESSDTEGGGDDEDEGTEDGEGDGTDPETGMPPSADESPEGKEAPTQAGTQTAKRTIDKITEAVTEQVHDQITQDAQVQDDIEQVRAALEDDKSAKNSEIPSEDGVHRVGFVDAPPEAVRLAREVSDTLRQLTDMALPHWQRRTETGRLNVGRFMRRQLGDRLDTMFDRFAQGMQDEVSLDVTILVDTSGSMATATRYIDKVTGRVTQGTTLIDKARQAVWSIQKAVEAAEGDCTVVGFDSTAYLVNQTGRRPHATKMRSLQADGGTKPAAAIRDTWRRVRSVDAAHKVVIVVSDGHWTGDGADVMRDLSTQHGVITVGLMLDNYATEIPVHLSHLTGKEQVTATEYYRRGVESRAKGLGCTYYIATDDCRDMVPLFKKLVSTEMEKAMNQRIGVSA
jgi:hypothetical protein